MDISKYIQYQKDIIDDFKSYIKGEDSYFNMEQISIIADELDVDLPKTFYNNFVNTTKLGYFKAYGSFKLIQKYLDKLVNKGAKLWVL